MKSHALGVRDVDLPRALLLAPATARGPGVSNLLPANLTVKAIMYTAACRFGGVLCGAACPVVFMSRSDTTATRLNSLALVLGGLA
jgi:hypothetical protein